VAAALFAICAGCVLYAVDAWPGLERASVALRFSVRGASRPRDVVVVAIDERTFSVLGIQWPFPRSLHGKLIDRLHADGARAVAYDVQFTEPTVPRQDLALYAAVARAKNVVLATTSVNAPGQTDVLGGNANLARAHAVPAAANMPSDPDGGIRSYYRSLLGLPSFAVAAVETAGRTIPRSRFHHGTALIDFRGPPATIPTVSFSDVLAGKVPAKFFAGRIVVVGATSPTLQDVHPTPTTTPNQPMAGPEIQANAIWTALHGNPLQPGPAWLTVLALLIGGAVTPLAASRLRLIAATVAGTALAAAYFLVAQAAFDSGTVLVVSYPLAAWALATIGTVGANYVAARVEQRALTTQLNASYLELVARLAAASESRDEDTGQHIQRIGLLCERLALAVGWQPREAELLRHASAMHDVGKIGIPDSILLKPGKLTAEEFDVMKTHTTQGAEILAGSTSPLVQLAEQIARCHHERWDGSGYPAGLAGEEIPEAARICAVCDVYDALLSPRPYKEAWTPAQALDEITRSAGTHLDPRLVEAFRNLNVEEKADAPERVVQALTARPTDSAP
jgi:CHASE2 domain-containing sensor protein